MDKTILWNQWLEEERIAHIHGWDFSHLDGRYEEEGDLPWDYRDTVMRYLRPDSRLLDLDTGGGEFLLSLGHPHALTAATEAYPPNVALCRETLSPLGIDFREASAAGSLPFEDGSFDLVINRHGDFSPAEIARVLKAGGVFVTQQVGAENDRELVEQLLPHPPRATLSQAVSFHRQGRLRGGRADRAGGAGSLPPHPLLRCGGAGLVCPYHRMGISRLHRGEQPGAAVSPAGAA